MHNLRGRIYTGAIGLSLDPASLAFSWIWKSIFSVVGGAVLFG